MASLEVRITEYRDNLRSIAVQMADVASEIERKHGAHTADELRSGIKLYGAIADDLTKVINGEPLTPFAVTGEL